MDSARAIVLNDLSNGREELGDRPQLEEHNSSNGHEFSLPQADGGKDAWLFLAACFIVEALVWGKFEAPKFNPMCYSKYPQAFHSHLESSKNITVHMSHSYLSLLE